MAKGIFTTLFNPESKAIGTIIDEKVEKFDDETPRREGRERRKMGLG